MGGGGRVQMPHCTPFGYATVDNCLVLPGVIDTQVDTWVDSELNFWLNTSKVKLWITDFDAIHTTPIDNNEKMTNAETTSGDDNFN